MKFLFFSIFLALTSNSMAANDSCNPESLDAKLKLIFKPRFNCLTKKEQILVNECGTLQKIIITDNWRIIEPPKVNCDGKNESECSLSRIDKIQYEQKYGKSTRIVVELTKIENNRFSEKISKTYSCGWTGDEYKIHDQ